MAASNDGLPTFESFTTVWHSASYDFISPQRPQLSASGKTVLVVGGGTGIGESIACAFAEAGAAFVAILGRREDRLIACKKKIAESISTDVKVLCEVADVLDRTSLSRAFDSVTNVAGMLDLVINSAGLKTQSGLLAEYDPTLLHRTFDTNVLGTLHVIQAFIPRASDAPVLLNIASGIAHTRAVTGEGAYNASKLAAAKLVDQFGLENSKFHVVNIHPNWVPAEMNRMQKEAPDDTVLPGHFCVWLASAEAQFLNGKFVWANWHAVELLQRKDEISRSRLCNLSLGGVDIDRGGGPQNAVHHMTSFCNKIED